jgi:hypothetical protein
VTVVVIDLIEEYRRHAASAATDEEREQFEDTLDRLDRFRACFANEDFPGERVRLALVLGDDEAVAP